MVAQDIQLMAMIIESERKKRDKTAWPVIPNILQLMDIPDGMIIDDEMEIIKMERR
jgi:hypothetical protein